jgi:hypothetical protein
MSSNGGATWATPAPVPLREGDRPFYTAPAVSPNGADLYIVVNAFTTPYRDNTSSPRAMVGEVLHADVTGGVPGGWTIPVRSNGGDPRGTSQNGLTAEFLGDYVYAAATNAGAVAVWNDASKAADCPAIDAFRASLYTSSPTGPPNVLAACLPQPHPTFGNSDIRGAKVADPTP